MKKKKSGSLLKSIIRQLHLWMGLGSGIVIFLVSITGCLWAFQEEIETFTSSLPKIEKQNIQVIPPIEARRIAHEVFPGRLVHGTLYEAENDPIKVIFYEYDPEFYHTVYLHPYTGKVLEVENNLTGFFPFVLEGHRYLWLPKIIGEQIVAWSTVIFAVMILSGIVLWWPKKNKSRRNRFTLDWKENTKWRRKNYDLHSVLGFYISFLAVVIIFTGLVMAFEKFEASVYYGIGGEKEVAWQVPKNISSTGSSQKSLAGMDKLFYNLKEAYPQAVDLEFHYPMTASEAIYVEIGYEEGVYYKADYRFYDQISLEEISSPTIYGIYSQTGFPEKLMRMNYDIHVGSIGGLPGKFIAFFASLLCASLPVTGGLMWYGRKFKKKRHVPFRVKKVAPSPTE